MWKTSARTYLEVRERVRGLDDAEFAAYRNKWEAKAVRGLTHDDMELRAKWDGFHDALNDEILRRASWAGGDDYETMNRLLEYLYAPDS